MIDTLNSFGMTGYIAEKALEECGIIINKNKVPSDTKSPIITNGIRLRTNDLALRNLSGENILWLCKLLKEILESTKVIDDKRYVIEPIRNILRPVAVAAATLSAAIEASASSDKSAEIIQKTRAHLGPDIRISSGADIKPLTTGFRGKKGEAIAAIEPESLHDLYRLISFAPATN